MISRGGLVLVFGLAVLAACGGSDDDVPGASSDGGSVLPDGAAIGPDGSIILPDGAVVGPDGGVLTPPTLEPGFVRLGVIGSVRNGVPAWTLRVYGGGSYVPADDSQRSCGVPELHAGCVVDTCSVGGAAGGLDAGTGPAWSGVVTIVDETRALTIVTDLATLGLSSTASIVQALPELVGALPGDVIHLTTQNVPGFPAIDVRLTVPTPAQIALGSGSLSGSQGTPFASVVGPDSLRLDVSQNSFDGTLRTAVCFFDRTAGQYTLPPIQSLSLACDETSASLYVLPIGMAKALVGTAGQDQALVYVVEADLSARSPALPCSP